MPANTQKTPEAIRVLTKAQFLDLYDSGAQIAFGIPDEDGWSGGGTFHSDLRIFVNFRLAEYARLDSIAVGIAKIRRENNTNGAVEWLAERQGITADRLKANIKLAKERDQGFEKIMAYNAVATDLDLFPNFRNFVEINGQKYHVQWEPEAAPAPIRTWYEIGANVVSEVARRFRPSVT